MDFRSNLLFVLAAAILLLSACSPKIYGTVQLLNHNMNPVTEDSTEGMVVNMINTTTSLEKASHSVTVNEKGFFESEKDAIIPGIYKVDAGRIGYETVTETVEIKGSTREKLVLKLKKILEGKRKSIAGSKSDEDKIINPGEVNIQPPGM
jgi:hypothetical protein